MHDEKQVSLFIAARHRSYQHRERNSPCRLLISRLVGPVVPVMTRARACGGAGAYVKQAKSNSRACPCPPWHRRRPLGLNDETPRSSVLASQHRFLPIFSSITFHAFVLLFNMCNLCLCFFSSKPLSQDEANGKYGSAFGPYANYQAKFDISMCQTPCREPCCWLASMVCLCPAQIHLRHKVLNHVSPNSGWKHYQCCQGYFGGCCCCQPGQMCDKECPVPCMCLEAFCCPGLAVSASANVMREEYRLGLDEDDVRLIRCSNCLQCCACLCCILSVFTESEQIDDCFRIVDCVADTVFCCVSGCMTAQVYHEVGVRRRMNAPSRQQMNR